jgi:hypothetical protein
MRIRDWQTPVYADGEVVREGDKIRYRQAPGGMLPRSEAWTYGTAVASFDDGGIVLRAADDRRYNLLGHEIERLYVHPADPSRDGEDWEGRRCEVAREMHANGIRHDRQLCGIPHHDRPDFKEPGTALARFTPSQLLRGYGQASGLRCFMFTTAAVYATGRLAAEAFADAHQLRGPQAREYHGQLS